jgi:hypothetical protein
MSATTSHQTRHYLRKRSARIFLCCIGLIVLAGDLILLRFAFGQDSPSRLLVGVLILQMLSSFLLLAAVWTRQAWARYVLIAMLFLVSIVFGLVAISQSQTLPAEDRKELRPVAGAVVLLLVANVWLIRSRRIQYLATPPGSGG